METRKSLVQPAKAAGSGVSKLKGRMALGDSWALRESHFGVFVSDDVQITSSEGGMRFCERRAWRVAEPSFPVVDVRASIFRDRCYSGSKLKSVSNPSDIPIDGSGKFIAA